jgi:SWI/SNF-related matrix-associated actin-dependent regulator of chromatin subfamily A3
MGLGKTLQTIGLILSNPPSGHTYPAGRLPGEPAPVVNDENAAPLPTEAAVQSLKVAELKMVLQDANLKPKGKRDDLVAQCLTGMKQGTIPGECFPSRLMAPVIGGSTRVCTLIVCPVSVMSNWDQQIQTHVKQDVLKVDFYQGANRADLLPTLKAGQIDVLLVSYHTLASEFARIYGKDNDGTKDGQPRTKKSKQESIFDVAFHRIVLDEAHTIRSSKTKFFKAVRQVDAERKLALTGTPFVNRADDIHSLLSFLGVEPLASKEIFRRAITIPIQTGNDIGLTRLRATMAHVALRRSKASANIQLVEKEVQLRSITFPDDAHKEVYDALFGTFRLAFQAVLQDEDNQVLKNYTSIFEKILRMRQACCSATLVPVKRREAAIQTWKELSERDHGATLTAEEGVALLEKLKGTFIQEDEQLPECAVCLMEMDESQCVILRTCSHVYCGECIGRVVSIGKPMCPLCRQPFQKGDMVKKSVATTAAATREEGNEKEPYAAAVNGEFGTSAKILALVEAIKAMQPDEKGVSIFTFGLTRCLSFAANKYCLSFTGHFQSIVRYCLLWICFSPHSHVTHTI